MAESFQQLEKRLRSARLEIDGVIAERDEARQQGVALRAALELAHWNWLREAVGYYDDEDSATIATALEGSAAAAEQHGAAIRRAALEEAIEMLSGSWPEGTARDGIIAAIGLVRALAEKPKFVTPEELKRILGQGGLGQ